MSATEPLPPLEEGEAILICGADLERLTRVVKCAVGVDLVDIDSMTDDFRVMSEIRYIFAVMPRFGQYLSQLKQAAGRVPIFPCVSTHSLVYMVNPLLVKLQCSCKDRAHEYSGAYWGIRIFLKPLPGINDPEEWNGEEWVEAS